jgi:hypothetical protein
MGRNGDEPFYRRGCPENRARVTALDQGEEPTEASVDGARDGRRSGEPARHRAGHDKSEVIRGCRKKVAKKYQVVR